MGTKGTEVTTQVSIINRGPESVKIEVQGRSEDGKFTAAQEFTITPKTFIDLWVHSTQSLQVLEAKKYPDIPAQTD